MSRNAKILMTLMVLMVLLAACATDTTIQPGGNALQQEAPTETPVPTTEAAARPTYVVQRGTVEETLEFTGRWLPRDQQTLSFEINGSVRGVYIQRNDTVNAGDLLIDFDTTDLEEQLVNAQLDLETAERRLAEDDDGTAQSIINAQFNLASAIISLESTEANAPWTSVDNARRQLETAQRDLENARRDYNEAISNPSNSATTVDNALNSVIRAEESVAAAQNNYYSAAQSYAQWEFNRDTAENTVTQRELDLQQALEGAGIDLDLVQSVDVARLNIARIEADIARASLVAPFDGVVLEIIVVPGDSVQAFDAVITLAIPQPSEVNATLAFNDTQRLSIGKIGLCQIANRDDTMVACAVRQIPLSSRDADQSARVAADFSGFDPTLGQLIEVVMPLEVSEDTLWLPPAAIRVFQNRRFVVVLEEDGERVADVVLGLQTDERVEIISGVVEGEVIVAP